MSKAIPLVIVIAMLSSSAGCQVISTGHGYVAANCAMVGASCSRNSRAGTVR